MRGVILAAGFGTRLWPLTEDRTKPAIPFLNKPLISYSVEYLVSHGITDLIVNLHHQPESITTALGDGSRWGAGIYYSYEEEILGTSGAIDRVRDRLAEDDFIVMNGKIVTSINLAEAIDVHRSRGAIATLVLFPNIKREKFSGVDLDSNGAIRGFLPFPERETPEVPLLFTGIQVLSPRIFEYIPRGVFSHSTTDVYPRAIAAGELVAGYVASEGEWFEMSTLPRYLEASLAFAGARGQNSVLGPGSVIENYASVSDSVLWSNVRISSGAKLRNCIVGDNVQIDGGMSFENSVIVSRDIVTEPERGVTLENNFIVPLEADPE